MLGACRVLDLTDGRGAFAGLLLAQLGADVVLVEPSNGLETRRKPPFVNDEPGPERSLVHHSFNRGKRSIVLDLGDSTGRGKFEALAAVADVVIESGGPSERRVRHHLTFEQLEALNPSIIHGVLSPFGSDGPKADWLASDIVVAAAGAQLSITGNPDMPPLRTAVPQTWLHASADLALGVLMSLEQRARSGLGQQVDISAQHSWTEAAFHYPLFDVWGAPDPVRNGSHVRIGPVGSTFDFPASDGHVTLTLLFGAAVGPFTNRFVGWMLEEEACDSRWATVDFGTYSPIDDLAGFEELKTSITAFTGAKTVAELEAAAWDRRLLVAPVVKLSGVLKNPHFGEREAFGAVQIPDVDVSVAAPGSYSRSKGGTLTSPGAAPTVGAHSEEVFREWTSSESASQPIDASLSDVAPLDGVKVLDLTISFAGPIIGRILAGHGATVIKVESEQRPDLTRTAGVFLNGDTIDNSACFATYNANKLSLGMNLGVEGAQDVLFDLVRWADVLVCSFAPGALDRMGLDREKRQELNPDLITLSSSLLGQTGSMSGLAGYGNMAAAVCGFFATTGWPGRTPVGPMGAYTDIISPRLAAAAVVSAIGHLRRTGEPTEFDFGQGESCLQLLTLGMLDDQVNGRSWERIGNVDHFSAPHGVYRALGEDEWVAIAVQTNEQWSRLAGIIGADELAAVDTLERLERRDELDALVTAWTTTLTPRAAELQLQQVAVPAHGVQNGSHCRDDEQLELRRWVTKVEHDRIGELTIYRSPVQMSRTPPAFSSAGPPLGHHSFEVLTEVLGYELEAVAELAIAGVLE